MPDDERPPDREDDDGPVFTGFGIGSAVSAWSRSRRSCLARLIWTSTAATSTNSHYRTRVMQAAADWTSVLINMNKDSVEASLNTACTRARSVSSTPTSTRPSSRTASWCSTLQAQHHRPGRLGGGRVDPPRAARSRTAPRRLSAQPELSASASRTDTVMVVATSISENAGADKPQTVRWTLRLDVSDVDGKLLISRLEPIR